MYSNNDFRSYSENHLEHRHKSPYAGGFTADGKNTSEYNHDYYIKNLWRWGVEKAGEAVDAAKNKINEAIDESETTVDDNLRRAYRSAKAGNSADAKYYARSAASQVGKDIRNAPSNTKRAINRAIDNSKTTADDNLRRAYRSAKAGNAGEAKYYARSAASQVGKDIRNTVSGAVESTKRRVNSAIDNSNTTVDDNLRRAYRSARSGNTGEAKYYARSAASQAGKDIKESAYNQLNRAKNAVSDASESTRRRINQAIDNSNTKVDDRLRSATRSALSGNRAATGMYLRSAGKAAVSETKDAINRRIDNSETTADDNLRRAYRSAREGNTGEARYYARSAASEIGRDAKNLARNAAGAVYEGGRRVAGATEKAVREGYGRLTNDRYDERNYTEGAQRRESNQGPNYNPREVGSDATLNERRQDEYNSRSINPQTGRLNRTATVNTNTERDNGDLTPIQKNRRQAEPEAPRRSLAGQNEMVTDSGTRSRYQKQRESNAGRNEERSDSGTRSSYNQSTYNREKDRGTLAGRNENTSDSGTRSSRTKDTEQRYDNYMGMFEKLAVDSAGASNSAASRGVQAASSAIRKYADAVEMYGSDSRQAQRAYQEAMAEVMDEVRANNRAYDSNRFLPNNGNLNSKSNLDYMKRSKRERERNRIWNG